jgi:hypothetical protein
MASIPCGKHQSHRRPRQAGDAMSWAREREKLHQRIHDHHHLQLLTSLHSAAHHSGYTSHMQLVWRQLICMCVRLHRIPGEMTRHGLMAYHTAYLLYCMCLRQGRVRLLDQGREVFPLTQCLDLEPQKQHLRHRLRACDRVSVHVVWCVSEANSKCISHTSTSSKRSRCLPSHSQSQVLPYTLSCPVIPV